MEITGKSKLEKLSRKNRGNTLLIQAIDQLVMILIEFEDNGEATIVWCGSHDEYETTFKNNKSTIKKWLNNQGLIN
jgi:hypothetical protein